ncbi:unnamed protein product [marine sediment metagenome]|uniref:Bacteriophage lambda Replication protein O N-terminal domain-containing protein n=1 Tax=marine sediment metagenome TaxID=412755 RepID=X1L7N6_9ZZZZ
MRIRSGEGWGQLPRRISLALTGARLNGYESSVVWAIVHKTIAFNKLEDRIPWIQLSELTGINLRHLTRTINSLLKKGVIFKRINVYGIQRDFSKWETLPNQVVKEERLPNQDQRLPNQDQRLPNQVGSRDLSKRAYQEKGLTPYQKEKERQVFMERIRKSKKLLKEILREKEKKDRLSKRKRKEH